MTAALAFPTKSCVSSLVWVSSNSRSLRKALLRSLKKKSLQLNDILYMQGSIVVAMPRVKGILSGVDLHKVPRKSSSVQAPVLFFHASGHPWGIVRAAVRTTNAPRSEVK